MLTLVRTAFLAATAPLLAAPEPAEVQPAPGERARVPVLQEKLAAALEQERKEQYGEALKRYLELIQSPVSTPEERWRWHMRTGWLYLLRGQHGKAERVFLRAVQPDGVDHAHEITVVVGGETRIEKVRDPRSPEPPPEATQGLLGRHWKYDAMIGLARLYADKGEHERAREWLDKVDTLHPTACRLCVPTARVTHAALLQTCQAASLRAGDLNGAFDQLHRLIDGKCWLPMQLRVSKETAREVVAREARLGLAQVLLAIGDPGKAKTFLEQAATGESFAAKLARAHLNKLKEVNSRPSERLPEVVVEGPTGPDVPQVPLPLP